MMVSYSHYKYQHLHHHLFLGTPDDKEIVDYDPQYPAIFTTPG
jgi:hypothetical protein